MKGEEARGQFHAEVAQMAAQKGFARDRCQTPGGAKRAACLAAEMEAAFV